VQTYDYDAGDGLLLQWVVISGPRKFTFRPIKEIATHLLTHPVR